VCCPSSGGACGARRPTSKRRVSRRARASPPWGARRWSSPGGQARPRRGSLRGRRVLSLPAHPLRRARAASRHSTAARTPTPAPPRALARFRTRSGFVANRGSAARSGRPKASQRRRKRPSFAAATAIHPSAARNAWYGTMLACALPNLRASSPVTSALDATLTGWPEPYRGAAPPAWHRGRCSASDERAEDPDRRVRPGEHVHDCHARLHRLALGVPVIAIRPLSAWTTKS
jgi:hypothetical protein